MGFGIGMVILFGCLLGGFAAMGGHIDVLWQPWEYVIILGSSIGTFFVANPMKVVKDSFKAILEAIKESVPKNRDYLDTLSVLYALMRELRTKTRTEMEVHVDNPQESEIFKAFPKILANHDLTQFICDYCRLIILGNARTHEIEALMDEEIQTIRNDKLKAYAAVTAIADGLPALGIVAAVLGVIKAMGSLDKPPEVSRRPDRRRPCRHLRRHSVFLRNLRPARHQDQDRTREEGQALRHRQADAARLHERRHAADCPRIRPQDHLGLRAPDHHRGRAGNHGRRSQGGVMVRIPLTAAMIRVAGKPQASASNEIASLQAALAEAVVTAFAAFTAAPVRAEPDGLSISLREMPVEDGQVIKLVSPRGALTPVLMADRPLVMALCEAAFGGSGTEPVFDGADRPYSATERRLRDALLAGLAGLLPEALELCLSVPFRTVEEEDRKPASREAVSVSCISCRLLVYVYGYSGELTVLLPEEQVTQLLAGAAATIGADGPDSGDRGYYRRRFAIGRSRSDRAAARRVKATGGGSGPASRPASQIRGLRHNAASADGRRENAAPGPHDAKWREHRHRDHCLSAPLQLPASSPSL